MPRLDLGLIKSPLFFRLTVGSCRNAYGISSIRPDAPHEHWLFTDCDTQNDDELHETESYMKHYYPTYHKFKTRRGYHFIVLKSAPFEVQLKNMLDIPNIDIGFVMNGFRRGYWFLETLYTIPKSLMQNFRFMRVERVA